MEIINEKKGEEADNSTTTTNPVNRHEFGTFAGVVMIVGGLLWLGCNYGIISHKVIDAILSWQMILVVVGVWLLYVRSFLAGGVLTGLGVILVIADAMNIYISFERLILPLLLIVAGVVTLSTRWDKKS